MIDWPWTSIHPALAAFNRAKRQLSLKIPPLEWPAVAIDLEYDQLDLKKARLLSIALVPIEKGWVNLEEAWSCTIQQPDAAKEGAIIHGLLQQQLASGLDERAALAMFLQKVAGKVIIGHAIALDVKLLNNRMRTLGMGPFKPYTDDTLTLARKRDGQELRPTGAYKLENLCQRYHIPLPDAHTAEADALATALLWLRFRKQPA